MAMFEWSSVIELGIKPMDDDHKILIGLMNELFELNKARAEKAKLIETFEKLHHYTKEHFAKEEQFMKSIGYPERETHGAIHRDLLTTLAKHLETYRSDSVQELKPELFSFLRKWLTVHILANDKRYAARAKSA